MLHESGVKTRPPAEDDSSNYIRSTALGDSVFRAATGGGPKLAVAKRSFCVWHSLKELKCTSTEAARRQSRIGSDNFRDS